MGNPICKEAVLGNPDKPNTRQNVEMVRHSKAEAQQALEKVS